MEQVESKNGTGLFAFLCPEHKCQENFHYLKDTPVSGVLECPNCSRQYLIEIVKSSYIISRIGTTAIMWDVKMWRLDDARTEN
jgi:hypothetical protein